MHVWILFKKSIDVAQKIFNEKQKYGQSINKSNKTEQNKTEFQYTEHSGGHPSMSFVKKNNQSQLKFSFR